MRSVLVLGLLISSPAVACDMDGMFGFNHYSAMAPDQAAADAMREAAMPTRATISGRGMALRRSPRPMPLGAPVQPPPPARLLAN